MRVEDLTDPHHGQTDTIHAIPRAVGYQSSMAAAAQSTQLTARDATAKAEVPTMEPGGPRRPEEPEGKAKDRSRQAPLRVDAQRNLEHVLRAAREVFGEAGYGAPMEDVARRARVGVGTVYRRFPSKDVLVQRIAQEETARLAEQARAALAQEDRGWPALARFLQRSVASGAGRLLPPSVLAAGERTGAGTDTGAGTGASVSPVSPVSAVPAVSLSSAPAVSATASVGGSAEYVAAGGATTRPGQRVPDQRLAEDTDAAPVADPEPDASARELLHVVGELVDRARRAEELRQGVSVGDVLLVIATAAPSLPDLQQRSAASDRLLDILLAGLRAGTPEQRAS